MAPKQKRVLQQEREKPTAKCTVFVRNLPYDATNEGLEEVFSEIGPIKSCFVVKDKGVTDKCRGFGYVTYADRSDAEKAVGSSRTLDGRKLQIKFADRKPPSKLSKKGKPENTTADKTSPTKHAFFNEDDDEVANDGNEDRTAKKKSQQQKKEHKGQGGDRNSPPKFPQNKLGQSANKKSNHEAKQKVNWEKQSPRKTEGEDQKSNKKQEWTGASLAHSNQKALQKKPAAPNQKSARLVIRNLSFKCSEDSLKKAFSGHGRITEVKIPKVPGDARKSRGFGFVQFEELSSASAALKKMNGQEIMGRPVAVDWSLPREKFLAASKQLATSTAKQGKIKPTESEESSSSDASSSDEDGSEEDEDDSDEEDEEKDVVSSEKVEVKKSNQDDSESDDDSDSEDDSGNEDASSESESDPGGRKKVKSAVAQDSDSGSIHDDETSSEDGDDETGSKDGDDETSSEDKEEDESEEEESEDKSDDDDDGSGSDSEEEEDGANSDKRKEESSRPSDVGEGKTLFVRNVPFETTNEELKEVFAKFGKLEVCRIVVDKDTEHSKGSAFVKYETREDAEKCMRKANAHTQDEQFTLDGRLLEVGIALPHNDIEQMRKALKKQEKSVNKDKRNLYLLREGLVREGTQAAKGVSEADMAKRTKIETIKRNKLKNINVFVSPTRMVVHNLPKSVDDAKLKKMFREAAADKKAKVTEVRVMRDMSRPNTEGKCQSLGYAFVEFTEHEHALSALRHVNNNPTYFGENKRPIVGFSLENKTALEAKKKRLGKNKNKGAENTNKRDRAQVGPNQAEIAKKTHIASLSKDKIHTAPKTKIRKGLPSHMGPKRRWRDKGKLPPPKKNKSKVSRNARQQKKLQQQEPKQKQPPKNLKRTIEGQETGKNRKRRRMNADKREEANFSQLVAQYKNKLFGNAERTNPQRKQPKSKWFDN